MTTLLVRTVVRLSSTAAAVMLLAIAAPVSVDLIGVGFKANNAIAGDDVGVEGDGRARAECDIVEDCQSDTETDDNSGAGWNSDGHASHLDGEGMIGDAINFGETTNESTSDVLNQTFDDVFPAGEDSAEGS